MTKQTLVRTALAGVAACIVLTTGCGAQPGAYDPYNDPYGYGAGSDPYGSDPYGSGGSYVLRRHARTT